MKKRTGRRRPGAGSARETGKSPAPRKGGSTRQTGVRRRGGVKEPIAPSNDAGSTPVVDTGLERDIREAELTSREPPGRAVEDGPVERDPDSLARELGIERAPEEEFRTAAEILTERDRRRR